MCWIKYNFRSADNSNSYENMWGYIPLITSRNYWKVCTKKIYAQKCTTEYCQLKALALPFNVTSLIWTYVTAFQTNYRRLLLMFRTALWSKFWGKFIKFLLFVFQFFLSPFPTQKRRTHRTPCHSILTDILLDLADRTIFVQILIQPQSYYFYKAMQKHVLRRYIKETFFLSYSEIAGLSVGARTFARLFMKTTINAGWYAEVWGTRLNSIE